MRRQYIASMFVTPASVGLMTFRSGIIVVSAMVSLALLAPSAAVAVDSNDSAVRPFQVHVPEETLVDLQRRLAATRWPDNETVTDQSQGVQLATMKELVGYWQTGYDWRKAEAKLNALPQFVTTIDGLDIYFIHVRSKHPSAMPLIITHGWPGSIIEELKIIAHAFAGRPEGELTRDEILDNLTLYWVTNTGASAARLYWENARIAYKGQVSVPTAFTVFPGELYRAPRTWVERTYQNLIYFHEVDKGAHFAAWEQPQLFSEEVRAAFRPLRSR